jgi:hypothetical protein
VNYESLDDAQMRALARELGVEAAERLDVEHTAATVLQRLKEEPLAGRIGWRPPTALRVAAAVVLAVGGGLVARHYQGSAQPTPYVAEDLRDLSTDQLRDVLSSLDETLDLKAQSPADGDLGDLNVEQLRAVLRSLES